MEIYNGTYCVYIHTNKINGKMYVGQTVHGDNPNRRWQNGTNYRLQKYFYRAIQKYGWDNFEHEIIASNLTREEARNFEKLLIKTLKVYDPAIGYNLTDGGESPSRMPRKGLKRTEEQRARISDGHKGIKLSEQAKQKISGALNYKAKPILQFTKHCEFVRQWECMMDASRALNIPVQNICACCNNKRKTAGGFIWKSVDGC
jgi:hypothetical protein